MGSRAANSAKQASIWRILSPLVMGRSPLHRARYGARRALDTHDRAAPLDDERRIGGAKASKNTSAAARVAL